MFSESSLFCWTVACAFRKTSSHQRPLSTTHYVLQVTNFTLLTADMITLFTKQFCPKLMIFIYFSIEKMHSPLLVRCDICQILNEWIVFGFESFRAPCTLTLKQAHCAPWSITRLKEPSSFTKVPDGPYTSFPNILRTQKEGTQMCMSEWSKDLTLTQNVDWGFLLSTTLPKSEVATQCH